MEIYICTSCGNFVRSNILPKTCPKCKNRDTFSNRKEIIQKEKEIESILMGMEEVRGHC